MASFALSWGLLLGGQGRPIVGLARASEASANSGRSPAVSVRLAPSGGRGSRHVSNGQRSGPSTVGSARPSTPHKVSPRREDGAAQIGIDPSERHLFGLEQHPIDTASRHLPHSVSPRPIHVSGTGLPMTGDLSTARLALKRPSVFSDLTLPELTDRLEARTLSYLRFYRNTQRGQRAVRSYSRSAERYTRMIQDALTQAGLPVDLAWLALIESGHNPLARSAAGAAGLWQFMPGSARAHGLTVNRWVDERLDPMRSTQAAISYLSSLKARFGTWELAMAAYNMGHFGLSQAIRKYNTNDFWRLARLEAALPWETALYVPKILAIATVMNNRQAFGLSKPQGPPAADFEVIRLSGSVTLQAVAEAAECSFSELQALNPHLLRQRTPPLGRRSRPSTWHVYLPPGVAGEVTGKLAKQPSVGEQTLTVLQGDTWHSLAERGDTSVWALTSTNQVLREEVPEPGSLLLVPKRRTKKPYRADPKSRPPLVIPPWEFRYRDLEQVFYRATPGDKLSEVAKSLQVTVEDLQLWNDLDARATLLDGMMLQAFIPAGFNSSRVRLTRRDHSALAMVVGSSDFFSQFEGGRGRKRLQIQARPGDTLHGIGRRYGLSGGTMARINHRAQKQPLAPGARITVYTRSGPAPQEVVLSRPARQLAPPVPPHPGALPATSRSPLTDHRAQQP